MSRFANDKVKDEQPILLSYGVNELARHRSVRSCIDFQQEVVKKRAQ